jgi:putative heme-binding domain-containing protein
MYLVTGGRGTRSGLYRVRYTGEVALPETPSSKDAQDRLAQAAEARKLRRTLEGFHGKVNSEAVSFAWPHLGSPDPWIRNAARIAVEHQPLEWWQDRALSEASPLAAATAMLALSRVGPSTLQQEILDRLNAYPLASLSQEETLVCLRAYALCYMRMGRPPQAQVETAIAHLEPAYPSGSWAIDRQLSELLRYLEAPTLVEKSLPLLTGAPSQEERLHHLLLLRDVKSGWTAPGRKAYFEALQAAGQGPQGHYTPLFLKHIRADAVASLNEADRLELGSLVDEPPMQAAESAAAQRPFVREWQLTDLADDLATVGQGRSFEQGKAVFSAAMCNRCHRYGGEGMAFGPDLAGAANRFSRRDLLESILFPSKAVDEKYRGAIIETSTGSVIVGQVVGGDPQYITISTNPLEPEKVVKIARSEIESQAVAAISTMPSGMLNTLSKEEILDLLAYLESGADPNHRNFRP